MSQNNFSKRFRLISLSMTLALMCLLLVAFWPSKGLSKMDINGQRFTVRVASTQPARERGLSGVLSLPMNQGMFFVFDKPDKYTFWMKDMLFPLDVIYILNGEIVDMALNMPTPRVGEEVPIYTSKKIADSVLEVNAGTASKFGWTIGTRVSTP